MGLDANKRGHFATNQFQFQPKSYVHFTSFRETSVEIQKVHSRLRCGTFIIGNVLDSSSELASAEQSLCITV